MPEAPLSETCVCGGPQWHVMIERALWCRRCGCIRLIFEHFWKVPLDRAGDVAATLRPIGDEDEPPTNPGTPTAKSRTDFQAVRVPGPKKPES